MRKKKNLWALETALVISLTACSSSSPTDVTITDTPTTVVSTSENDTSEVDETTTKPTSETTTVTETTKKTTTGSEETKATTTAEEKKTTTADTEEDTTTTAEKETAKAETEAVKETEQDPAPETPSGASTPETTVAEAKETAKAEMQTTVTTTKKETATAAQTAPVTTTTEVPTATVAKVVPVSITATVSGTHYIGDSLTGADFTVTVKMSDGSTLTNPAGFTATPLALSGVTNSITVAYSAEGKTVSTTITVKAGEKPKETTQVVTTTAAPTTTTPAATETQPTVETEPVLVPAESQYVQFTGEAYATARKMFDIQNEYRAEAGVQQLVWSDTAYQIALKCAKINVENNTLSHELGEKYREFYTPYSLRDKYYFINNFGEKVSTVLYGENLASCNCTGVTEENTAQAKVMMYALKNSYGHYLSMTEENANCGAIAVWVGADGYEVASCVYTRTEDDEFVASHSWKQEETENVLIDDQ